MRTEMCMLDQEEESKSKKTKSEGTQQRCYVELNTSSADHQAKVS